jgi:hypothetical protein
VCVHEGRESVVRKGAFSKCRNNRVWLVSIVVIVCHMEVIAALFENLIYIRGIEICLLRFVSIPVSLFRQPPIPLVSSDKAVSA